MVLKSLCRKFVEVSDSKMKNQKPKKEVTFETLPKAMAELFEEVNTIKEELAEVITNFQPKEPAIYMTRNDVALMLSCDLSTIHSWTKKGKLIPYGIGNRVYYKRNEVEAALIPFGKNKGESYS